jgi:hypothetical protein
VLELMADGMLTEQIAGAAVRQPGHRAHARRERPQKLQVPDRAAAIRLLHSQKD